MWVISCDFLQAYSRPGVMPDRSKLKYLSEFMSSRWICSYDRPFINIVPQMRNRPPPWVRDRPWMTGISKWSGILFLTLIHRVRNYTRYPRNDHTRFKLYESVIKWTIKMILKAKFRWFPKVSFGSCHRCNHAEVITGMELEYRLQTLRIIASIHTELVWQDNLFLWKRFW